MHRNVAILYRLCVFFFIFISNTFYAMDHAPSKSMEVSNYHEFDSNPSLEPASSQSSSYQSVEPYFLNNPTTSKSSIESASKSQFSNQVDPLMVTLRIRQEAGDKKGIELIRKDLDDKLAKAWFGKKAIKTQIEKVEAIYNARITSLLSTVKNGTKEEALKAIKEIKRLSPYVYDTQVLSQVYSLKLESHINKVGFNYLVAAEIIFQQKYGGMITSADSKESQKPFFMPESNQRLVPILEQEAGTQQPLTPSALEPDLVLTTPTDSDLLNQQVLIVQNSETFAEGFLEGSTEFVTEVTHHPIKYAQNFAQAQLDLAKEIGLFFIKVHSAPDPDGFGFNETQMEQYEQMVTQQAEKVAQLYNYACEIIPQMSAKDWGKIVGRSTFEYIALHGVGKGATKGWSMAKNARIPSFVKENPLLGKLHSSFEQLIAQHPEMVTAEGFVVKGSEALENTSVLKNTADKVTGPAKTVEVLVNQTSKAVLKNGYYEVNGFRFTEYYYNRLWNGGRKAPSLTVEAILGNTKEILPDPKGYSGFYKYVSDGWYMIYNPTTKIVSHLEPLK